MATLAPTTLPRPLDLPVASTPTHRSGARSFFSSVAAELYKLGKRPATWLLAALFALVIVVFNDVVSTITLNTLSATDPDIKYFQNLRLFEYLSTSAVGVVAAIGGPIALILGALISGSEYGWTTFKTVLTQGPSRLAIFGSKAITLAILTAGFVILGWIASATGSLVVSVFASTPVTMPAFDSLISGLGFGWLIAMVWGTIGLALGLIFRTTTVPIGLGLIWGLAVENLITLIGGSVGFFATIQDYLIGPNATALANRVGVSLFSDGGGTLSTTHALLVLAGYIVVLSGIAATLFKTRDLV